MERRHIRKNFYYKFLICEIRNHLRGCEANSSFLPEREYPRKIDKQSIRLPPFLGITTVDSRP